MSGQKLAIRGIHKEFGAQSVLRGVDIDVAEGELVTLLGPSGCGKSTLLRIIAGFDHADHGRVELGGRQIDHLPPKQRNIAMVFQSYALYPHMTVFENISMPLVMRKMSFMQRFPLIGSMTPGHRRASREIATHVEAVADQLEIRPLLKRRPGQLSGGQRQRVAVGRAIVRRPGLFLMDEPLSNLDAKLRAHMRSELVDLNRKLGATFLYVTHDQVEAMTMSDRIVVMREGAVSQIGTPEQIYGRPADLDVARFVGQPQINVLPASVNQQARLVVAGQAQNLLVDAKSSQVFLGIRPEALRLVKHARSDGSTLSLEARLHRTELLGAEVLVWLKLVQMDGLLCVMQMRAAEFDGIDIDPDGIITIESDLAALHVFGEDRLRCQVKGQTASPTISSIDGRARRAVTTGAR